MWHDVIMWCIACSQPAGRPKHDLLAKQSWLLEEHPLYTWEYFCQHEIGWTFFSWENLMAWLDCAWLSFCFRFSLHSLLSIEKMDKDILRSEIDIRTRPLVQVPLQVLAQVCFVQRRRRPGMISYRHCPFKDTLLFVISKQTKLFSVFYLWLDCELLRSKVNPIVTVVLQHRRRGIHLIEKQVGI